MNQITKKLTDVTFGEIVGTESTISSYDKFLDIDTFLNITPDNDLKFVKNEYKNIVNKIKTDMEILSLIEEVIIQIRCRECITKEMKLSILREYIYVRSTFYRRRNEIKDIRICVGKTDVYGTDVRDMELNEKFMEMATNKMVETMNNEIKQNLETIKYLNNV